MSYERIPPPVVRQNDYWRKSVARELQKHADAIGRHSDALERLARRIAVRISDADQAAEQLRSIAVGLTRPRG